MLEGFHLEIAQIAMRVLEPRGFALGGGCALQAHGVTERPSKDLDSYSQSQEASDYQIGEESLVRALEKAGYECKVERRDSWFRQITVTNPESGEQDVGLASGEANEGGVVLLALCPLAVVVRP